MKREAAIGLHAAFLAAPLLVLPGSPANAKACPVKTVSDLKAADAAAKAVAISCDLRLDAGDVVRAPIELSGSKASNVTIDCGGGTLDGTGYKAHTLAIRSIRQTDGSWDVPHNVTVRNCTIKGDLRIIGMAENGQGTWLKQSSISEGHTARAQAAAPAKITVSNVTFIANGRIPLYAGPGTTGLDVSGSQFIGSTNSVVIYFDAESAGNIVEDNVFNIRTKSREQIALDGSADNRIAGNTFTDPVNGGIFLYRNCGEGGTIRHQAPQRNVIIGNTFRYKSASGAKPAVWIGSRQGNSRYCFNDAAYPFGSSLNSRDFAEHNSVTQNLLPGGSPSLIVNNDADNQVSGNR
ncbi:NosD domain-containing protein [Rhizobium sp. BG4]|uniref:NosD domain-containing protein n=1 Tax=Rhizobium sp. BG4 TaxID=2613770 RepID=UPI00193D08B8|nr:NosD domain-containing protein [Rhizobium sp. BG4]QRM43369.1 right-handed parallel beta-helix repeat-containing protein [Rhizobium sp. BG4]